MTSFALRAILAALAIAPLSGCNAPAHAQSAVPEIASRCLMREHDEGGALANCTLAIQAGHMSVELLALMYNVRGEAHCQRQEYDLALTDQNAAIRLAPNFPQAYVDRASCHLGENDVPAALADYARAIELAPVPGYFRKRAKIYNWIGRHDLALADYDKAIALAPRFNTAMDERGMTLFDLGRYDEAARQLAAVVPTVPGDPFAVLWLHIARLRAHEPDAEEFAAGMKTLDLSTWPGPLFDLFLGKTTLEAVRAASSQSPYGALEGECESALFGGEYQLSRGETAAATQPIEEAANVCDHTENQYLTAWAELKRLVPAAKTQGPW